MSRRDLMDDLFGTPSMESLETVNKRLRAKRGKKSSTPKWETLKMKFGELYQQVNGRPYIFANSYNEKNTLENLVKLFGDKPDLMNAIVEFYFLSGQTKIPLNQVTIFHMKGGWLNGLSIDAEAYLNGTYTPQQGEKKRNREWIPAPVTAVASEKARSQSKPNTTKRKRRTLL